MGRDESGTVGRLRTIRQQHLMPVWRGVAGASSS